MKLRNLLPVLALGLLLSAMVSAQANAPLIFTVISSEAGTGDVNATLITGATGSILVDGQFANLNAHRIAIEILKTGKPLKMVYLSHGHPDHLLGLEVIHQSFPEAKIVALGPVVKYLNALYPSWLKQFQGPGFAKTSVTVEPFNEDHLDLDGHRIEILSDVQGDVTPSSALWIPSERTLIGGDTLFNQTYLWTAESDAAERKAWLATLDRYDALKPSRVIPGHMKRDLPLDTSSIAFTRQYLQAYESELSKAANSTALVEAMNQRFPGAGGAGMLGTSAKVNKGELKIH